MHASENNAESKHLGSSSGFKANEGIFSKYANGDGPRGQPLQQARENFSSSQAPKKIAVSLSHSKRVTSLDDQLITAMALMVVTFSLLPAGLEWISYDDFMAQAQGTSWRFQLQWLSIFAIALLVALRNGGETWALVKAANSFLILMLLYTTTSILWSVDPSISFKRVFQFAGLLLTATVLQISMKPIDNFFNALLTGVSGILLASAIVALVYPSLGHDSGFGTAWRGILNTKNDLGFLGAMGVILWVVKADSRSWPIAVSLIGGGISALCIVQATSSTGIATALIGVTVFLVLRKRYIDSPLWLTRLLATASIFAIAGVHWFFIQEGRLPRWGEVIGPFAALFGKGTDLTGRTEIWEYVFIEFQKHPILGVGWGAFWLGPGSASQPVLDQLPWIPFQAHNGYLDILNELGSAGMLIFICMLLVHAHQLYRMLKIDQSQAACHISFAVIVLFSNFSESTLYKTVAFHHMLLIFSSLWASSSIYQSKDKIERASMLQAKTRTIAG